MSARGPALRDPSAAPLLTSTFRGACVGTAQFLGPFATPALAIRWFLHERWSRPLGSGWLGEDLVVLTDAGLRVRVPLRGTELASPPSRESDPLGLEPRTPAWIVELVARRRAFRIDETRWVEVAIAPGDRVAIRGRLVVAPASYRAPADDVDALVAPGAEPVRLSLE